MRAPAARSGGAAGVSHDNPRAQMCTFEGPGASNTTKIQRKGPTREGEKKQNCGGREKKSEILGGPAEGVRRRGSGRGPEHTHHTHTTTTTQQQHSTTTQKHTTHSTHTHTTNKQKPTTQNTFPHQNQPQQHTKKRIGQKWIGQNWIGQNWQTTNH